MYQEEDKSQILKYYSDGESIESISRKYSTHTSNISKLLKEEGVIRKRPELDSEEVMSLYSDLGSVNKVGKHFGVHNNTIKKILEKEGVKTRSLAEFYDRKLTSEQEKFILEHYPNKTALWISRNLKLPYSFIRNSIKEMKCVEFDSNPISKEKDVIKAYHNLEQKSIADISVATGCSTKNVRAILRRHQLSYETRLIDHETKAEIIDLYNEGSKSVDEISELFGGVDVQKVLVSCGVSRNRSKNIYEKYPHITKELLNELYVQDKKTQREIGDMHEVPPCIISRFCREYGIQTRDCVNYGIGTSRAEEEIYDYISSFYQGKIIRNDRSHIKELDIFIPELSLGVEFNGCYWHSSHFKGSGYHREKYLHFRNLGVRVIQIWEDQWADERTRPIIKSLLKSSTGIMGNRIYGRKCKVVDITNKSAKEFLHVNHMQGSGRPKHSMGLLYDHSLIGVMTFNKIKGVYHIDRLAYKMGYSVIGGTKKLFKHFIENIDPSEVHTYSSNDLFTGRVYESLGFSFSHTTQPRYYYIKDNIRYSRQKFQKKKLVSQGSDISKTEKEIMEDRGYLRIHDSGNTKWILKLK